MALIEWRCSWSVKMVWRELVDMLNSLPDGSGEPEAIIEEIRSLPGYPQDYDIDRDEIIIVTTTVR